MGRVCRVISFGISMFSKCSFQLGVPEDLAVRLSTSPVHCGLIVFQGAIVYLCSDVSKFVTGSELRVDGGYCLA